MQLTARHEFAASPQAVYAMCTDPAFLEAACVDVGAVEHAVEVLEPADAATTRVRLTAETVAALARFAGATVQVDQSMAWGPATVDGSRTAQLSITLPGLPVTVAATARLAPTASGSAIDYSGHFTVAVPLVGAMVEKQAAPYVLEVLDVQQRTGDAWLAAHPR